MALTVARWALDEEHLAEMKERAEYFGLDKAESFSEFERKYLAAVAQGVESSGESGIMSLNKKTSALNSKADPMADVFGAGDISNSEEIRKFREEIKEAGVELVEKEEEALAYEPVLYSGLPGKMLVSNGASYSAWCHEMQHMRDDREAGWIGMGILADTDKRYEFEKRAYGVEIEIAQKAGRQDVVAILLANLEAERKNIYGE